MESNNSTPDEVDEHYNTRSKTQTTDKDVSINATWRFYVPIKKNNFK